MTFYVMSLSSTDSEPKQTREIARHRAIREWIKALPKPVGIFCTNDIQAERVGHICDVHNILIPEEVAVLGYGNLVQCEIAPIPISSIAPGLEKRIHAAMRLLNDIIQGAPSPTTPMMIPPLGIEERRSTHVLAVPDPVIAKALRFLWDHYREDISVEDVLLEVGVARRTLERGFQHHLHRSIREELRRRRLDVAAALLRSTIDNIADIAAQVGYRSSQYLHKCFQVTYGVTPRQYRQQHPPVA